MSESPFGAPLQGGAFSAFFNAIVTSMNTLGSIWIFVLMVMIDADAFGRTFLTRPIHGVNELVELSLIGIVFLQLGDATRRGRLTRSDGFFRFVLGRAPRVGRLMGAVFDFLGVIFMVIILIGAIPDLIDAWEKDYFVGEVGLFTAPEWPIKAVVVIGCLMTLLQFLVFGWRYVIPRGVTPVEHVSPVD